MNEQIEQHKSENPYRGAWLKSNDSDWVRESQEPKGPILSNREDVIKSIASYIMQQHLLEKGGTPAIDDEWLKIQVARYKLPITDEDVSQAIRATMAGSGLTME